jgi:flagellar hook-associated protein 2
MGISALGTGSSILTQDLIDKLRKADETAQIQPIDFNIADNKDKAAEFDVIDANMTNLYDAMNELKTPALFDERSATIDGTSIAMTADANSDVQDFTLDVKQLATKEMTESDSFGGADDKIATDDGSLKLSVGDTDYTIDYNADMTLTDLKNAINDQAGDDVTASIIKVGDGDYKLFFTATHTGDLNEDNNDDGTDDDADISIIDNDGNLSDDGGDTNGGTNLTDNMDSVQTGVDATFTYNGGDDIHRSSNSVDDLISGYHITLKETGSSDVKVARNDDAILGKIDSFVKKYNSAMSELGRATKNSTDSSERGIFAGESTFTSLQRDLRGMMDKVGGGVGTLYDYGFDIDKDGTLSIDKTAFTKKLDVNASNVEIFFSGGDFENTDGSTTTIDGAFAELTDNTYSYTRFNGMLDNYKTFLDDNKTSLEESKTKATQRLDSKYETMKKQFAAYDAMIAQLNNSSAMFTQMQNDSSNNN